jgi:hypothetical protein
MLIWVEPFDQYATGAPPTASNDALIAQFGYTDVGIANFQLGRTGPYSAWLNGGHVMRRALDVPASVLGQGAGFSFNNCPGVSQFNGGFRWESAGKVLEFAAVEMPDLSVGVYDRTGTLVGRTAPNVLVNSSFVWIETKVSMNVGAVLNTGSCEVRINGVSKLIVNGINLPNQFAFVRIGTDGGNGGAYYDDWIVWDNTGTANNNFMGDRRLVASFPNANAALQNFTPSAGNAFACVNQVPPVDTTFIDGAAAGNISEFTKPALTISSNDIAAMVICGRLFKSDAGAASGRVGVNSNANVSNSAELFPGITGSWFRLIQELDPNGNVPWTRAAYDAANIRITRVT